MADQRGLAWGRGLHHRSVERVEQSSCGVGERLKLFSGFRAEQSPDTRLVLLWISGQIKDASIRPEVAREDVFA